ncbi:MAG: GGDEF domain-containing protein [Chloroflexota bacterium]
MISPVTTERSKMNQNIVILLIVLVAINIVLIAVAIARSILRRRRERDSGTFVAALPPLNGAPSPIPVSPDGHPVLGRSDALTGLLVPGEWNRIIADEDARNDRYGHPATVAIIEIEGIDRLVAALGPGASDRILPAVADTLSRNARGADHLARLGPARFGVLLPETGEVEAINYIERVREACDLWLESGAVALSLAIGWASPTADVSLVDAVALAHERMYAELRRNTRRTGDLAVDGPPPFGDIEGSPSPA